MTEVFYTYVLSNVTVICKLNCLNSLSHRPEIAPTKIDVLSSLLSTEKKYNVGDYPMSELTILTV